MYMDTIRSSWIKPLIKELNNTLLKILNELQTIKIQQQEFINIIKENSVPTKEEVSKGWFF
jgi:t-SNARE complex subunit (syntaxin)